MGRTRHVTEGSLQGTFVYQLGYLPLKYRIHQSQFSSKYRPAGTAYESLDQNVANIHTNQEKKESQVFISGAVQVLKYNKYKVMLKRTVFMYRQ